MRTLSDEGHSDLHRKLRWLEIGKIERAKK
jgi:hypothetical protein